MELIGFALAALIGMTLGLLGAGGSILTVPVFVYVLGFAAKPAIAMSLPVIGTTSLVGALSHWRSGNVQLRTALLFGGIAMAGAYTGARLAVFVSGAVQLTLLAIAMLGAAFAMFRGTVPAPGEEGVSGLRPPASRRSLALIGVTGLGIGMLTGLVGVGGGFLVVPALVLLARLPMSQAIGTSLVVIAMNTASGALGYVGQVDLPWSFLALFTAIAVGGILVGTYLLRFVSQRVLRRGFAVLLVVMSTLILYQNRVVLSVAFDTLLLTPN
jgi:hypothetical protein